MHASRMSVRSYRVFAWPLTFLALPLRVFFFFFFASSRLPLPSPLSLPSAPPSPVNRPASSNNSPSFMPPFDLCRFASKE